ncbi:hypothetical protein QAD02_018248 [Eretmocerus hayati]|uniref:Uncharacterized protein n=1 Tax=Eretmocerus hayati TaxID=131215 RepID=A0ACC2PHF1_9HYME|nr:hypothetical protein QAD02_018248 [Eretmocerus hayati]
MNTQQLLFEMRYCAAFILVLIILVITETRGENHTPQCWNNETKAEEFAHIAIIKHDDCDHGPHHSRSYGAIISEDYVLTLNEIRGKCESHMVHIGCDASGKGGYQLNATLKTIGKNKELSLFKLEKPIEHGPLTQPIKIMSAGSKTGDSATRHTAMVREDSGILSGQVSTITEENCREMLKKHGEAHFLPKGWFCTEDLVDSCPTYTYSTLIIGGELAGLGNNFVKVPERKMISRYIDIAQYKSMIESSMKN